MWFTKIQLSKTIKLMMDQGAPKLLAGNEFGFRPVDRDNPSSP
jgi:hypothetical protein